MSKKAAKSAVFCRIDTWLAQKDIDLYEAAERLCAIMALKPRPGGGVTFLYPTDQAYRQEIIDGSFGKDSDQLAAEKMFKALVLHMYLPDAGSFQMYADDIPNALGVKIQVSVKGQAVTFNGDLKATLSGDFAARSDRANMAVWELSGKDRMPVDGQKSVGTHGKKKKQGGARLPITDRKAFAHFIEERFRHAVLAGKLNDCDPYLEAICSLFVWLKGSGKDDVLRALLACSGPKWRASFYIIFQPYAGRGGILGDSDFVQWQNETTGYCFLDNPGQFYLDSFKYLDGDYKDAFASKESRAEVRKAIESVRSQMLSTTSKSTLAQELQALYRGVASSNQIGSLSQVYPAQLAQYYSSYPEDKAVQEEIRFLIGNAFDDLFSAGLSGPELEAAHKEIVRVLEQRLNFQTGFRSCIIFNQELQSVVVVWYSGPFAMLRSNYLLFCGAPEGEVQVPGVRFADSETAPPDAQTPIDIVSQDWSIAKSQAAAMKQSSKFAAAERMIALTRSVMPK